MSKEHNAGIVVSGNGTFTANVVAVGFQARAEKVAAAARAELAEKGLTDVQAKLEMLMTMLKDHAQELPDPRPAFDLAERVAGELRISKPDKSTVKGFLTVLAEETKSVAEIAGAAL